MNCFPQHLKLNSFVGYSSAGCCGQRGCYWFHKWFNGDVCSPLPAYSCSTFRWNLLLITLSISFDIPFWVIVITHITYIQARNRITIISARIMIQWWVTTGTWKYSTYVPVINAAYPPAQAINSEFKGAAGGGRGNQDFEFQITCLLNYSWLKV